jgi:hypothetical protein
VPGVPRYMACPRVFRRAPERFSALRPPSIRVSEARDAKPGRRDASRERGGACLKREDRATKAVGIIVPSPLAGEGGSMLPPHGMGEGNFARTPHPLELVATPMCPLPQGERAREAAAARLAEANRKGPHPDEERAGEIVPPTRTRVRASRTIGTSQLMRPHASRRRASHASVRALHELACAARSSARGQERRRFAQASQASWGTTTREEPTCACGQLLLIVSALLFTMKIPTPACEGCARGLE